MQEQVRPTNPYYKIDYKFFIFFCYFLRKVIKHTKQKTKMKIALAQMRVIRKYRKERMIDVGMISEQKQEKDVIIP
jgi:hypothetical protein